MTPHRGLGQRMARAVHRAAALVATVVTVAMLTPGSAWAHVSVDSTRPNGDGTTTVVLSFDHGCPDSPTVSLDVDASGGVEILSGSTSIPGWSAELIMPTRLNFLGDPVASGEVAQVEIVARITGIPGQPVRFPTYQRCVNGDGYSWTDTAPGAQYPAPEVIATAAILAPAAASTDSGADRFGVLVGIGAMALAFGAAGAAATRQGRLSD
jgi:hypothetical protein